MYSVVCYCLNYSNTLFRSWLQSSSYMFITIKKKKKYLHYFVLCTWVLHFIHLIKIKFKQQKTRRARGILPAAVHNWMIDRTSLVLPRSCSKHLLWGLSSWPAATACTESPPIFNSRRWIHGRRAEDVWKSCWSWHNCFKVILRRDKG